MPKLRKRWLSLLPVGAASIVFALVAAAALPSEKPEKLQKLELSYSLQLEKVATPISEKYLNALSALQKKYEESGDLKGALAVRGEAERIKAAEAQPRRPPDRKGTLQQLAELRKIYREELIKARSKVDQIYIRALTKLEKDLTRDGELDGAILVKEERERAESARSESGKEADQLRKFLTGEWDREGDHLFVEFAPGGEAFHRWSDHPHTLWAGNDKAHADWNVSGGEATLREYRNGRLQSTWKVEKLNEKSIRISPVKVTGRDWISGEFRKGS